LTSVTVLTMLFPSYHNCSSLSAMEPVSCNHVAEDTVTKNMADITMEEKM